MISLKDFLDTIEYKITGGDKYQWTCFGPNAQMIDSDSGWDARCSASVIFDTKTQEVYEVSVCDYDNKRAYRMIHPDYVKAYEEEAKTKGVDGEQAWDDIKYTDLEVDSDWLEKAAAILAGEEYDTSVVVSIDIDSDTLFKLMKAAHEENMTFNAYVERAIKEYCEFV